MVFLPSAPVRVQVWVPANGAGDVKAPGSCASCIWLQPLRVSVHLSVSATGRVLVHALPLATTIEPDGWDVSTPMSRALSALPLKLTQALVWPAASRVRARQWYWEPVVRPVTDTTA